MRNCIYINVNHMLQQLTFLTATVLQRWQNRSASARTFSPTTAVCCAAQNAALLPHEPNSLCARNSSLFRTLAARLRETRWNCSPPTATRMPPFLVPPAAPLSAALRSPRTNSSRTSAAWPRCASASVPPPAVPPPTPPPPLYPAAPAPPRQHDLANFFQPQPSCISRRNTSRPRLPRLRL